MSFEPITGNEYQINNIQISIHDDSHLPTWSLEDERERVINRIKKAYEGETAHKIVRIIWEDRGCSFLCNAGHEENLYNDIRSWIQKSMETRRYPFTFYIGAFVSYSPLREIKTPE